MERIFGKLIGCLLGFLFYGIPGAVAGFLIGHVYDHHGDAGGTPWRFGAPDARSINRNQQRAFTMGVIVLGAKMAKADGRVTRAEIEAFRRVFPIAPRDAAQVGRIFDQARTSVSGFEPYAFQLSQMFGHSPAVLEQILSGLFAIAVADSAGLSPAEIRFLQRVALIFNFDAADFWRIAARSGVKMPQSGQSQSGSSQSNGGSPPPSRSEADESYAILGVNESATNDEIKVAYRVLIRKHHPDMLLAAGMAPSFIAIAEEKMKRINVAYDVLSKRRGIK